MPSTQTYIRIFSGPGLLPDIPSLPPATQTPKLLHQVLETRTIVVGPVLEMYH